MNYTEGNVDKIRKKGINEDTKRRTDEYVNR